MERNVTWVSWVDPTWASVSAREDLDGVKSVVFTPDRQLTGEDGLHQPEIVMDAKQARQVARALNRAARRLEAK